MRWFGLVGAARALAFSARALALGRIADVSVVDRVSGLRVPVHRHGGQAYVVATPGVAYRVLVRSREGAELLVVVPVDGENIITGDTAEARSSLGTGHGRSETSYARQVPFERATSDPAETLVIRYDRDRKLVAMGVIRTAQVHPRRFPGFVPDA